MAKYTTEVRTICEFFANQNSPVPSTSLTVDSTISSAIPSIFSFNFPIFDESYRIPLETKILRHFYTREIGFETFGLWQIKLETKLNEIMPYYNQLYKSELLEFNPFYDVELGTTNNKNLTQNEKRTENATDTFESETNSKTTTETTDSQNITDKTTGNENNSYDKNNTEKNAYSDTPQTQITNVDNYTYLTNYRNVSNVGTDTETKNNTVDYTRTNTNDINTDVTGNITTNSTNMNNVDEQKGLQSTEDYIEKVSGKRGTASYSQMLQEFRQTFLNIDMEVIESLDELFMQIW